MAFFGNKAVQSRIDEAVTIIDKMASGDFTSPIDTSGSDVVVPIMRALKKGQTSLERRITDGRRATDASGDQQEILNLVAGYLERIAQGDIPPKITTDQKDDASTNIKKSLNKIISTLNGFQDSINYVSNEHAAGDIDVVIDTNMFTGSFKAMSQSINDLVAGHIAVKKKAMACIKELGEGNFDAPLEQFPGKKAFINNTIEKLRSNLKSFIADMNTMSDEHDKGDIDVVIDTGKFQGSYKTMAQSVNGMVSGHIDLNKKAIACVRAFGEGDFEAPLEQFTGKKAFINDTIEQVRKNLKALMEDAYFLAAQAQEGNLSVRVDAECHKGDFRKIIIGINNALDSIVLPIQEAIRQITQDSRGEMGEELSSVFKGDFAELKKRLNYLSLTMKGVINSCAYVKEQHDNGDIDVIVSSHDPQDADTKRHPFAEAADGAIGLETLLAASKKLPPLPEHLTGSRDREAHRVVECQTPVFLWLERDGETIRLFADVPRESPTVRGFVSLLVSTLDGGPVSGAAELPADLLHLLGLDEALGMMRSQGLGAIVHRVRRSAAALG